VRSLSSRVHLLSGEGALSVFSRARELEAEGRDIVHLELGEPDFHPSDAVRQAAKNAMDAGLDRYASPPGLPQLRVAVADYLWRTRSAIADPDHVLIAPGCKMILSLIAMTLIEPGDEVLYPDPGFPIYVSLIRMLGGIPVTYDLRQQNGFQPDVEEIVRRITPRTKLLIINSPGNPTGTVISGKVQQELAALAIKHDLWVISDEIYARMVYDVAYTSISILPGMSERTIIVDGFSKSFAMTGWRLGYAVVPEPLLESLRLLIVNTYTCTSEFIQYAGIEALADSTGAVDRMVAQFHDRRGQFIADLSRIPGFRCSPPDGAFYAWVNIEETGMSAANLSNMLLEEAGVAGIDGAAFGGNGSNFLRFSFASSTERLQEAVERIEKISHRWQTKSRNVRLEA
jgi:aspartate aminotransferase